MISWSRPIVLSEHLMQTKLDMWPDIALDQLWKSGHNLKFKISEKYGSGLSCRWALFTAWAFGFKLHFIFQSWVKKSGLIFYLADFHGRNWCIPGFYENKTQYLALFSTKPTKVGFIFIGTNSLSRADDLAAVNHVTQAVVRVGLKIGFLNRVLNPFNHLYKN